MLIALKEGKIGNQKSEIGNQGKRSERKMK